MQERQSEARSGQSAPRLTQKIASAPVTILDDVLENDKAELVQTNFLSIQEQIAQLQDYDEEDISNTDEDDCSHNIQSAEASLLKMTGERLRQCQD